MFLRVTSKRLPYNAFRFQSIIRHYSGEQLEGPSISPLPFGDALPGNTVLQSFKNSNWIFVDKTDIIYQLIKNENSFILTRPRRFGKSLLLSTIQMIFEKNEIIKSLKIGKHYDNLISHPVIRFDFSTNSDGLKGYIWNKLNGHANKLQISIADLSIQDSLVKVLEEYSKKEGKVCILVDEYDKPLWVDDENLLKINKKLIEDFFTTVKSLDDHVRFMLVLGVTRNNLSGLFSGPNNLKDLTLNKKYAALLGFTLEEIETYFPNHINLLAKEYGMQDNKSILESMTKLYNGYQFSKVKTPGIYNPVSVIDCFENQELRKYWTATADGSYSKLLQASKRDSSFIYKSEYSVENIEAIDHRTPNITQLLWQTGYLTIKDFRNGNYYLRATNEEVKDQLDSIKYAIIYENSQPAHFTNIKNAIREVNVLKFSQAMSDHTYVLNSKSKINNEKELEKDLMQLMYLAGFKPRNQQSAGDGIVDIIFEVKDYKNDDIAYVFELKTNKTASQALLQIKEKGYYKEAHQCKKIVCIGLSLDEEKKIIGDVEYIIIDSKTNLIIEHGALSFDLPSKNNASLGTDMIKKVITPSTEKESYNEFIEKRNKNK